MEDLKQIQEFFGPPADVNTAYRVDFTRIENKEVIKDFELFKDLEKAKSKFEQLKKDPFMGSIKIEKIYGGQSGDGDRYLGGSEEIGSYSNPVNNTKSSELTDEENDIKIYMTTPSFISAKRGYKEKEDLMAYLSRRKKATSDFVNGALEEMDINDPVLIALRAKKMANDKKREKISSLPKPKKMKISQKAADLVDGYELEDLEMNLKQIYRDMEQEAEPEGGPIADQYADEIEAHEQAIRFIKNKGKERAQMTYDQAIAEDEDKDGNRVPGAALILPRGKEVILQAEEKDYKRGLLVELTNKGGYKIKYWYGDDVKVYPAEVVVDGESIKKDAEVVDILFHPELKEGDTYEKMAAKGKKAGNLKQGTVRKRLNIPKGEKVPITKINKELSRLKKMDKDKDKKGVQLGDKNQKYYKALQLAKTLKTTTNVNEMEANEFVKTVNDEFDLETLELMKKVIDSRVELLNKMKDVANPRTVVKGFRRYDEIAETIRFIKENNPSATVGEIYKELREIKELGETITEELCAAGKAYRKRRMAAGEKSSAYLSGRAVKVCKGQMSGRKKKKK